ncbi:MAG: nucleotidyl transferase AbiEii/AbiGii toxin family protein [Myxococcales bacterium]|nr:nucleotidyl transferase AbiEii/AbiGii toxin family protein [Myxococcales bacterium]
MTPRRYATPEAFKLALETRIRREVSATKGDIGRFRQLLIFDRFLARVFAEFGDHAVVKGGVVLELRLTRARTTRDVDLRIAGEPAKLLERMQGAGQRELGDHLSFLVEPDADHPTIDGEGVIYEGRRFRAEAHLAGRLYGMPFGVDAAFGDVLESEPDVITGSRFLEFVGVEPATLRIYPRETHVAEKLHAYTLPRRNENSRVKDLPDIALLGTTGAFEAAPLRGALTGTFGFRKTHALPSGLPDPPSSWAHAYARMAEADHLPWGDLESVTLVARAFLDPILAGGAGWWDPAVWRWSE